MKIRIRQVAQGEWIIEKRYWFWFTWFPYEADGKALVFTEKNKAIMEADKLMDPIEVQRERKDD